MAKKLPKLPKVPKINTVKRFDQAKLGRGVVPRPIRKK